MLSFPIAVLKTIVGAFLSFGVRVIRDAQSRAQGVVVKKRYKGLPSSWA